MAMLSGRRLGTRAGRLLTNRCRRRLCTAADPHLRIVAVNDVYELDTLPRLKSLVAHHRQQQVQRGGMLRVGCRMGVWAASRLDQPATGW